MSTNNNVVNSSLSEIDLIDVQIISKHIFNESKYHYIDLKNWFRVDYCERLIELDKNSITNHYGSKSFTCTSYKVNEIVTVYKYNIDVRNTSFSYICISSSDYLRRTVNSVIDKYFTTKKASV